MKKSKIRLGINIDHAATLRQVRGGTTAYPDILRIANLSIKGGAEQITIHLREDRRHIQEKDLALLAQQCRVPLNLEMASTDGMVKLARKYKPDWVCFVPEKREELTTEGGLNVVRSKVQLSKHLEKLQMIGIEISMFIEPSIEQVRASFEIGADAVELHTGKWVSLQGEKKKKEWKKLVEAAREANDLGMAVHAGHGLDFQTAKEITKLPFLEEVNIGHSVICHSLEHGIEKTVRMMKKCLN